jgi:hypothetical protein
MKIFSLKELCLLAVLFCGFTPTAVHAQSFLGTWVRKADPSVGGGMNMTVEVCCSGGRRISYRIPGNDAFLMSIETHLDGTDAPLLIGGKPSGETMAIKRVDDRHATTVLKMNGKTFGTSKAEVSADGKTLNIENEFTSAEGGRPPGRYPEVWVRK